MLRVIVYGSYFYHKDMIIYWKNAGHKDAQWNGYLRFYYTQSSSLSLNSVV